MNIILCSAPALFLVLLKGTGAVGTISNILPRAVIQILLGLPFHDGRFLGIHDMAPLSSVVSAGPSGRSIWKFLSEEVSVL